MAELVDPRNGLPSTTGYGWNTQNGHWKDTRGLKQQALAGAENAKESAKHQIESVARVGKDKVVDQLDSVARVLRSTSDHLGGEENAEIFSQYAQKAGETVERASKYLREHEAVDLVGEVERVARAQPLVFFGGAFALGLVLGRFLKSGTPPTTSSLTPERPARELDWYEPLAGGVVTPEPEESVITSPLTRVGAAPSSFTADEGAAFRTDPTDPFARTPSTYRGTGTDGSYGSGNNDSD